MLFYILQHKLTPVGNPASKAGDGRQESQTIFTDGFILSHYHDGVKIIGSGMELTLSRADYRAKVVKRYNHTFYETLREKLMWGADIRAK